MKTFFLNAPHNVEVKNFLRGDFYSLVKNDPAVRLVVFVSPDSLETHRRDFANERCIVEPVPDFGMDRQVAKKIFRMIALASIPTESMWIRQLATYRSGGSFSGFMGRRLCWFLGHLKVWREILRFIEYRFFFEDRVWAIYFDRYRPDVVFAPSLMIEEDTIFLKQAKRRGIPSVGMVRSWDNFSTKLLLRIIPNILLVQNEIMRREAIMWNDVSPERIRVVGFAQFSHYRDSSWHMTKEETARMIGLDPTKKWIVYYTGGLPTVVLAEETYTDHLEMLMRASERGLFSHALLAVRAHPTDPLGSDKKIEGVPILDFGKNFTYQKEDMKLLLNLVRWTDVNINLGSTMSLESAIFNRPVVLVGFNGADDLKVPLHNRLSFALDHTTHYLYVQKTGGVWRVKTESELIYAVTGYLHDPALHKEGRSQIVSDLVGPIDGKTGERVFAALNSLI